MCMICASIPAAAALGAKLNSDQLSLPAEKRRPVEAALQWANQPLLHAGLRTMQTFDLSAARAGAHDCLCPYHGTEQCDCQMVILLVYGSNDGPETLILHGNDGKTWLSLAHTMQPVSRLAILIQKALDFKEASS